MTALNVVESLIRQLPTHSTEEECSRALVRGDENVAFPAHVDGSLHLAHLRSLPVGTIFPDYVGGSLNLYYLKSLPPGVVFPAYVGGNLNLSHLTALPEGTVFPTYVGGYLYLNHLKSPPKSPLPRRVGGVVLSGGVKAQMVQFSGEE